MLVEAAAFTAMLWLTRSAFSFQCCFAVFLLYHWNRTEVIAEWTTVVALWSFAAGVRGILWHQLEDAVHDKEIGLRTFPCLHPLAHLLTLSWQQPSALWLLVFHGVLQEIVAMLRMNKSDAASKIAVFHR